MGILSKFGLFTKSEIEQARADSHATGYLAAEAVAKAQNDSLLDTISLQRREIDALRADNAQIAALRPDAEKWRAKQARAKDYEATKRVRKPRAKKGAA